ncbi:Holliday junction resolvase RecU [Virgibacillus halodenitrificans]|uniref:Holliday junction resolvase RecU n=1 Tax=Virgibacillus halodenitrificans TaxID=1482 RepID=UPI00136A1CA5|nr:Holliday junction resolvase RecU [Virgibacillus halodenitrificans]MYL45031.1 Holliday junction resolvase RecU [Virgibacillus halodenitrificans]
MTVYTGKRGQSFETSLNYTNEIYINQKRAIVNKRPTPVKVLKSKGTRVLNGYYEEKSTVDYDGVYQGKSIVFEAKTTKEKRLPLSIISDHQIDYLEDMEKQGAISFLIVEMRVSREVYLVPNNMLRKYVKASKQGGRKSIPLRDLEIYAHLVKSQRGVPIDYLSVVDQLLAAAAV